MVSRILPARGQIPSLKMRSAGLGGPADLFSQPEDGVLAGYDNLGTDLDTLVEVDNVGVEHPDTA